MRVNNSNYLKRLKNKKEDALEFIVDKYLPLVKGVTFKVLYSVGNNEVMEECINDIFLSIWNNSHKFNGDDDDFRKWICAIAKFKAIDYYRKLNKNLEIAIGDINEKETYSVEDEVIFSEEKEAVIELLNTLNEMDRKIFIMKFFLDIKSEDIAKRFGVTKASIDNRIYRGKKKLREKKSIMNMEVK